MSDRPPSDCGIVEAMADEGSATCVVRVPERMRYEIRADGRPAGYAAYLDTGTQRIFYHTEIDKAFAHRGLARTLVTAALSDTRVEGKRVVPVCPYVMSHLRRHHEFDDIVDPASPAALDAAMTAMRAMRHRQDS